MRLAAILGGLLVLQIAGAVALTTTGPDYGAFRPSEPLLAFDPDAVDKVTIETGEGKSVVLRRQDETWILPGLYDFPADGDKVAGLVKRLAGFRRGLPVATSDESLERFKVTEDVYERRIVLAGDGGTLGEILIGTSPSYRQVHARTPDDEAVYSVEFATYDAGAEPDDWTKRDALHLSEEDIQRIVLPSLTLVREEKGFVIEGLAESETADKKAVDQLVDKIARLSFIGVEGRGKEALERIGEPALTVTVERKEAPAVTFRLAKMDAGEDYLLAASTQDWLFRVAKYTAEPLLEAKRETLVKKPAQQQPDNPSVTEKPAGEKDDGSG